MLFNARMSTATHLALGEHGESLAVRALEGAGYAVLARRYRTRLGEIDIIARDGTCLVFVEVKARTHRRCGRPTKKPAALGGGELGGLGAGRLRRPYSDRLTPPRELAVAATELSKIHDQARNARY